MPSNSNLHALVFGASGVAGWAVVDQLLSNYPSKGTFSKVTALVNRPLDFSNSYWPQGGPELQLVSGINLMDDTAVASIQDRVQGMEDVTHVFYFAYKQESDRKEEVEVNRKMLQRVVRALEDLSPKLEMIVQPSGTSDYGIYLPGGFHKAPLVESMDLPEPHRSENIHYPLRDVLEAASKDKAWSWCDIRPDAIIGFSPTGSNYNLTAHWASYLSLYAHIEGKGATVAFPGTDACWVALSTDASAAMIARASIWAALHPECTSGQIFNIADSAKPKAMKERWPALAAYFGLVGVGPGEEPRLMPGEYVQKHQDVLRERGIKSNDVFGAKFLDTVGFYLSFDRQLSLEKIRNAGFEEEANSDLAWFKAFDRFKEAGMILP